MSKRRILFCNCAYAQIIPRGVKAEVLKGLVESGVGFEAVPDLCEMAARKDPALSRLADSDGDGTLKIAACYPRAVKWLFHAAGTPLPEDRVEIFNMRSDTAATTVAGILEETAVAAGDDHETPPEEKEAS